MKVDASAREAHFLDHLAPVWRALDPDVQGTVYVDRSLFARALELDVGPVVGGWPERSRKLGPILCASWGDLRIVSRCRRPVIFAEHGAGQSYGQGIANYVGGRGRDAVVLFLAPSERAAAANRASWPAIPNAVVGSPRVDELAAIPREGPPAVAISFHWRCAASPEAGTAFDHYRPALGDLAATLRARGVELLGHGHPRILDELRPVYAALGVEVVDRFVDVVRRADAYIVDNSSTMFEFAALDRPVVVLNAPAYRRTVEHGLRFWTEADVGVNVDEPDALAGAVLEALDDPPELARSRRAAVARTYALVDGTAARRAAEAIEALVVKRCRVCGANHASCGRPTTVVPVDGRVKERSKMAGTRKRYPNPERPGAYLLLSDAAAERLGLLGTDHGPARRTTPPRSIDAATNPGGDALVTSTTAAAPAAPVHPKGALAPAGVTHRARAKAGATSGELSPDEVEAALAAPVEGDDDEQEEPVPEPEPTAPAKKAAPKDKRRPAPSSRRRRRVEE